MVKLLPHPLADLVPKPSDEEYKKLKIAIETHGQREAIVLYQGKILDGRTRYAICEELKLSPKTRVYHPEEDGVDPVAFVADHNLHRRHLNLAQRAATLVLLKKAAEAAGESFDMEKAAKAANVPEASAKMAEKAVKQDPTALGKMKAGKEKLTAIAREAAAKSGQDQRAELLAKRGKELSAPLRKAATAGTALATLAQLEKWLSLELTAEERARLEPLLIEGMAVQTALKFEDEPVGQQDPLRHALLRALIDKDGKYTDTVTNGPQCKAKVTYRVTVECFTKTAN